MRAIVSALMTFVFACLLGLFSQEAPASISDLSSVPHLLPYTSGGRTYTKAVGITHSGGSYNTVFIYAQAGDTLKYNPNWYRIDFTADPSIYLLVMCTNGANTCTDYEVDTSDLDTSALLPSGSCFSDPTQIISSFDLSSTADYHYETYPAHCEDTYIAAATVIVEASDLFSIYRHPLPGGKNWLLTTQIGGNTFCSGNPDSDHTGSGYYSLDFDDISQSNGQEADVPIYAVAAGIVDSYTSSDAGGFGYTVVIDHQNGYKSRYAHMVAATSVTSGYVYQGQQLGVVGSSGNSSGTHLHLQFYYNGSSASTVTELGTVKMDGLLLSQYTVGCYSYYSSTNTQ